jgi:glycosyltransferase involved in cell wall biosynthesis
MGPSASRKRGIRAATVEFIIFLDSDDFKDIDVAQKAVQIAKSNNLDIANYQILEYYSDDRIVEGRYSVSEQLKKYASRIVTGPRYFDMSAKTGHHIVSPCSRIYRTAYLQGNRIFFFEGILNEDDEYYPRVFASAERVMFVEMPCYYRTLRTGSITTSESLSEKRFEGFCIGALNLVYLVGRSPFKTKYIKRYIHSMIRAAFRESFLTSHSVSERIRLALAHRIDKILVSTASPDAVLVIIEILMGYRFVAEMKALVRKVVRS